MTCRAAQRAAVVAAEADAKFAALMETPEKKRQRMEASGKAIKHVTFPSDTLEQARPWSLVLDPFQVSTCHACRTNISKAPGATMLLFICVRS
jgi:hypothetical protein